MTTGSIAPQLRDDEATLDVLFIPPWRFRKRPQIGVPLHLTWRELARWLSDPLLSQDKASHGGFTLAKLRNGVRRKSHVLGASALGIDYDGGAASLARAHAAFASLRHIAYTTASHVPTAPRWRVIVGLCRSASVDEYALLWRHAARMLAARGIVLDPGAKDACRLWYVPTVRPGAVFESCACDGASLDVDAVTANALAWEERERARSRVKAAHAKGMEHDDRYVRAALRRAADAFATATPGERHLLLCREAFKLARFEITEHEIASVLLPAFVACAGEARRLEGERAIRDAFRARRGAR